ncbi:MAG TPA: tyrosinase family protein [Gemmataceae bacterium]
MSSTTRREFLAAAGATIATSTLVGPAVAQPAPGVRRDITSRDAAQDLADYRTVVGKMRQKDPGDKRSWQYQATIHQNSCPHGNWFFLPWHRAYLLEFEEICRALLNKPAFMLPYWNWTANPAIPDDFWGQGNDLANGTRRIKRGAAIGAEFVGQRVMDGIMALPDFVTFGSSPSRTVRPAVGFGDLESKPHNNVHNSIGGDMQDLMSPLDPIFWPHHANIDRIWSMWSRNHSNPSENDWLNLEMDFVDKTGGNAKFKPAGLLNTRTLGYRYDTEPATVTFAAPPPRAVATSVPPGLAAVATSNAGSTTPQLVQLKAQVPPDLRRLLNQLPANPEAKRPATFRLKIEGVAPLPDDTNPVSVRVFINCDYLAPRTPPTDLHHVGTFSFFGERHRAGGHSDMAVSRYLDATPALRRLYGGRDYPDDTARIGLVTIDTLTGNPKEYFLAASKVTLEAVE